GHHGAGPWRLRQRRDRDGASFDDDAGAGRFSRRAARACDPHRAADHDQWLAGLALLLAPPRHGVFGPAAAGRRDRHRDRHLGPHRPARAGAVAGAGRVGGRLCGPAADPAEPAALQEPGGRPVAGGRAGLGRAPGHDRHLGADQHHLHARAGPDPAGIRVRGFGDVPAVLDRPARGARGRRHHELGPLPRGLDRARAGGDHDAGGRAGLCAAQPPDLRSHHSRAARRARGQAPGRRIVGL
ncbi:MAG: hypothetical protein AVDCRST_MAG90-1608, partial [uncultured Microvirga sp.]